MRNNQIQKITTVFLALISLASSAADNVKQSQTPAKAIYGADSRTDYYNMSYSWQKVADSTVALIKRSKISKTSNDKVYIQTKSYGWDNDLCSDERFYSQKTAAFCSGALVGPDLIMTAGHCIQTMTDCDDANFVFDFKYQNSWSDPTTIPASKVYGCSKIVAQYKSSTNDYALIQLDRPVMDRGSLQVASTGYYLSEGTKLAVIGHPWGLPVKMADGVVTDDSPYNYFQANLDTFAGNSGSPVFNRSTGLIEGILVRGREDFEEDSVRHCNTASRYSDDASEAEEVTRINQVASKIRSHNSNQTSAIQCSLTVPSQPVVYGASYTSAWSVDGHLPKGATVSLYSYTNGVLDFNQTVYATDVFNEKNGNMGSNRTIERGLIVRDNLGNALCQAGPAKFVQEGLASSKTTKIGAYITHLYTSILGRQPEDSGFAYWYELAANRKVSCSQLPASFLSSPEFQTRNRQLDNTGFMTTLYHLVFNREPDLGGLQFWLGSLASDQSTRQTVINGFLASQEFNAQCTSYGLPGAGVFVMERSVENFPDSIEGKKATPIGSYITHLYTTILGRQPEDEGFVFWYNLAIQRKVSCSQLPASFLSSPEFQKRNRELDRTEFVTTLYQLVLQRDPDAAGLQFWLNSLNTGANTRQSVVGGFLGSQEFNNQCNSYGLDGAGAYTMDAPVENLP